MKDFAVIETGGKQYMVSAGSDIKIEKLPGNNKAGDKIAFDKVLLLRAGGKTDIGVPYMNGKSVSGTITKIGRRDKILVVRYKAKSRRLKRNGHKQPYCEIKIELI